MRTLWAEVGRCRACWVGYGSAGVHFSGGPSLPADRRALCGGAAGLPVARHAGLGWAAEGGDCYCMRHTRGGFDFARFGRFLAALAQDAEPSASADPGRM